MHCGRPRDALFTFITELVDLAVKKKDLTDELARAGVNSEELIAGSRSASPRLRHAAAARPGSRGRKAGRQPDGPHHVGDGYLHGRRSAGLCGLYPTPGRRPLRRLPHPPLTEAHRARPDPTA